MSSIKETATTLADLYNFPSGQRNFSMLALGLVGPTGTLFMDAKKLLDGDAGHLAAVQTLLGITAGGGATIASTTNLVKGNGSGNGVDSGIDPDNVLVVGDIGTDVLAPNGDGGSLTNLTLANVTGLATALSAKADATALDTKADLVTGKVPSSQLPSYVDDVLEFANFAALPGTGETEKIYVTLDDNLTYRWSGSAYVEISASLALGETSGTAYRGDRGKIAYDHSQVTSGNPHNVTAAEVGADPAGTAASAVSSAAASYATAAQGATADTALQPAALSGYGDIVTHNVAEFATAAQGAKADTAMQPRTGTLAISSGTGNVSDASIFAASTIAMVTRVTANGTPAGVLTTSITNGNLAVHSDDPSDASTIAYLLIG